MAEPSIRATGLGKRYRIQMGGPGRDTLRESLALAFRVRRRHDPATPSPFWALRDVSFEIGRGEVVGIIGANGAGKSTLLKILSRITQPTTGQVELRGRVRSLLEVGTGFHDELSGRENILLNGAILGMSRTEIRARFDEIVAFSGVERFLDMPVKRYSSGMYLRLAFSVAAHLRPEILLVDEVLAVGDAEFQKRCLGKMDEVAQEGRTVVFVSHQLSAVRRLCPRTLLMEHGCLTADGPTEDVAAKYLSEHLVGGGPGEWLEIPREHARSGTGSARFVRFRYWSDLPGFQPYADGPLWVSMEIESSEPRDVGSLAFTLYDVHGMKLVNADTLGLGRTVPLRAGRNTVTFAIHSVHLSPGEYVAGLWIADPLGDVIDWVENAARIVVTETNSDAHGIRPTGMVTCRFDFSMGLE